MRLEIKKCLRETCGHTRYPRQPGRPAFCPKCHSPLWDKPKSKMVPGTRYVRKDGYAVRKAISGLHVLEHIFVFVAEKALGKKLPKGAVVHHANEDRSDNRNSNLVICPNNEYHRLIHRRLEAFKACSNPNWIKCGYCHKHDDPNNLYIKIGKRRGDYRMRNETAARHPACAKSYMKKYHQTHKTCGRRDAIARP